MIVMLGSRCAACQAESDLTFDCIEACGGSHHRLSSPERITFYRAQMRAGNVQLLCKYCNSLKSDTPMHVWLIAVSLACSELAPLMPRPAPAGDHTGLPPFKRELIRRFLVELERVQGIPF